MTQTQVLLEYKFKIGDILKYKSYIETKQEAIQNGKTTAIQNTVEMNLKQRVVDFSNDVYKMEILVESGIFIQNNNTQNLPAVEKPSLTSFKKNGELVADQQQQNQFSQQTFPSNPINIGEVWSSSTQLKFPGKSEPITINYKYIFEKIETIKNISCAFIKVECLPSKVELQPEVTQVFEAAGHVYFAHNEGFLVKSHLKTINTITAPKIQTNTENNMTIELIEINGKIIQ